MSAITMPARAAERMPSVWLPVSAVAAKPVTAPASIMPSTPRLSTPERSATSSPSEARRSGVAAVITVRMMAVTGSTGVRPEPGRWW